MEQKLVSELNTLVSSLSVTYAKLHNLHWNVTGLKFLQLHKLYEELYDEVTEMMDEVAENLLMLGHTPVSTVKEHLELSYIKEVAPEAAKGVNGVAVVLEDFKTLNKHFHVIFDLSDEAGVVGVNDLMTQFIAKFNKHIWILSSILKD